MMNKSNPITNHTLLTKEQEQKIAKKAFAGDEKAQQELVDHNLRLVASIAKRYNGPRIHYMDAISAGTIGLIQASKRFDPSRGVRFSTYATYYILLHIRDTVWYQQSSFIQIPKYIMGLDAKVRKGVELTPKEEINHNKSNKAREGYTEIGLAEHGGRVDDMYSVDHGVQDDLISKKNSLVHNGHLAESVMIEPDDDPLVCAENLELLYKALNRLTRYDQSLIRLKFGFPPHKKPMTLSGIAKIEGLSKERIRQKLELALQRLRAVFVEIRGV